MTIIISYHVRKICPINPVPVQLAVVDIKYSNLYYSYATFLVIIYCRVNKRPLHLCETS